jgi:hypothetical protein
VSIERLLSRFGWLYCTKAPQVRYPPTLDWLCALRLISHHTGVFALTANILMPSLELEHWVPQTQMDKDAVMAQLEKLVSHPALKSSKRCPALLRYILEHQLQGKAAKLKERMIGIELFGRETDYDSNADPVVRTTANDLRKRIAQYYHERGHESEPRISLPPGSYLAEFHLPETGALEPIPTTLAAVSVTVLHREQPRANNNSSWLRYAISACLILTTIVAIAWRQSWQTPRSLGRFWGPLAQSSAVLVCVGTWNVSAVSSDAAWSINANTLGVLELLPMTDAVAFSRIAAFLGETRTPFRVESARNTTLADLTQAPVVVIGAVDNPWTLRITDPLRFHFIARNVLPKWAIADRKDNGREYVNSGTAGAGESKDYAIVGRIYSETSGQTSVIVAGLGAIGTTAGAEFVTDARYIEALSKRDSRALTAKNTEILLAVDAVDGKPGAPQIVAVEAW